MNGTQLIFHCGDVVRERDGRHLGIVIAAFEWTVRVQWIESRFKQDLPLDTVELVESRAPARYSARVLRNRRRIGLE